MTTNEKIEQKSRELFNIANSQVRPEDLSFDELSARSQLGWECLAKHVLASEIESRIDEHERCCSECSNSDDGECNFYKKLKLQLSEIKK